MDRFKYLPEEIALDILSRLPAELVLECKLVSPAWRNLIRHPSFGKMHLYRLNHPFDSNADESCNLGFLTCSSDKYYSFEYNENHESIQRIRRINLLTSPFWGFVGSCNGLICLAEGPSAMICNPITRECVMLPQIIQSDFYCPYWTTGFGYLSSTDEYKVVEIYTEETEFVEVYIYTLGSGKGWRNIGKFYFESSKTWFPAGIFANGALYWLDTVSKMIMIITFDLAEEKFCQQSSPPPLQPGGSCYTCSIGVLGGFLYVAVYLAVLGGGVDCYDVWLLKKKSVHHEKEEHHSSVWSREFEIDQYQLVAITKSDGVLTYSDFYINIYDTKTASSKRLVKFKDYIHQVSPHRNTFVSLKELGEEDTNTMESVDIEETRSRDYSFEQLEEDE